MSGDGVLLAIDIGGTKTAVAIATPGRHPESVHTFPTGSDAASTAAQIVDESRAMLGGASPLAIGVSFGGPVVGRRLRSLHVPGWESCDLLGTLERRFGAPARVLNDGEAGALGEYRARGAAAPRTLVYVTVSTGIGGGLVVDGEPVRGVNGLGMEVGHMVVAESGMCACGRVGHLEAHASGTAIERRAATVGIRSADGRRLTGRALAELARDGHPGAVDLFAEAGRHVGRALATVANLLDPDVIVVGGGVALAGAPFWVPLRTAAGEHLLAPTPLELSPHAGDSALLGALELAQRAVAAGDSEDAAAVPATGLLADAR